MHPRPFSGNWFQNKRKGLFHIIDGEGVLWTEKYDDEGKRAFRKKVGSDKAGINLSAACTANLLKFSQALCIHPSLSVSTLLLSAQLLCHPYIYHTPYHTLVRIVIKCPTLPMILPIPTLKILNSWKSLYHSKRRHARYIHA